jgi:CRP-like cAMP-binding protein
MFDLLMGLPLFRGVSHDRIADVVGATKFHFLKFEEGNVVVSAGEPCTHIQFIISGSVRMTITSSDRRFAVSQTLVAPDVIAPDFLFGRAVVYPSTVIALEPTSILQIAKNDYLKILNSDPIFIYNILNMLSTNAQKSVSGVLALTSGSIEERLAFWIVALTQPNGKDITLTSRQRNLYTMYGIPRQSFLAALDGLKQRGMIDYNLNEIKIMDRRDMLALLHTTSEDDDME